MAELGPDQEGENEDTRTPREINAGKPRKGKAKEGSAEEEAGESPDEEEAEESSGEGDEEDGAPAKDPYHDLVKQIIAHDAKKPSESLANDHNTLKSRIVEHLKKKEGHKDGDSEEHLHSRASEMIYAYKDAKRKAEEKGNGNSGGMAQYNSTLPSEAM